MNSVMTFNSGIVATTKEQQVCKNVIEKFGQAMLDHDIPVLQELFNDFFANVVSNFKDFNVIKTLNKMNDILFDLKWHNWDERVIDEYINALGKGQSKLMTKYS